MRSFAELPNTTAASAGHEFGEYLPASPAGADWVLSVRSRHDDQTEIALARPDGRGEGIALGACSKAVGAVLDIRSVKTEPSTHWSAEPTLKREYGEYEALDASRASANNPSISIVLLAPRLTV